MLDDDYFGSTVSLDVAYWIYIMRYLKQFLVIYNPAKSLSCSGMICTDRNGNGKVDEINCACIDLVL
ncbi:hypothetical protein, partial [Staphylococcus aureus]